MSVYITFLPSSSSQEWSYCNGQKKEEGEKEGEEEEEKEEEDKSRSRRWRKKRSAPKKIGSNLFHHFDRSVTLDESTYMQGLYQTFTRLLLNCILFVTVPHILFTHADRGVEILPYITSLENVLNKGP